MLTFQYLVLFSVVSASFSQDPRLFVGPGWQGWGWQPNQAEFLNFPSSESQTPCASTIPEHPLGDVWGTVGLVVEGKIVICGGTYRAQDHPDDTQKFYSECFVLVMDNTSGLLEWKEFPGMNSKRAYGTSILLEDGSWMVLTTQVYILQDVPVCFRFFIYDFPPPNLAPKCQKIRLKN